MSGRMKVDDIGEFCACDQCVKVALAGAEDFANGSDHGWFGSVARPRVKRVLGWIVLAAMFELVGLGAE